METEEGGIGKRKMEDYDGWRKASSRDGWMDDGGKVDFGITLCGIGMNMNGSMLSHSPQRQIPFPSSYSPRRGHTSILQVALHQHHRGY